MSRHPCQESESESKSELSWVELSWVKNIFVEEKTKKDWCQENIWKIRWPEYWLTTYNLHSLCDRD